MERGGGVGEGENEGGEGVRLAADSKKKPEARRLPLSESEGKRGSDVMPKCALCNGGKYES